MPQNIIILYFFWSCCWARWTMSLLVFQRRNLKYSHFRGNASVLIYWCYFINFAQVLRGGWKEGRLAISDEDRQKCSQMPVTPQKQYSNYCHEAKWYNWLWNLKSVPRALGKLSAWANVFKKKTGCKSIKYVFKGKESSAEGSSISNL